MAQRVMESQNVELRLSRLVTLDYALAACYRIARERARVSRTFRGNTLSACTHVSVGMADTVARMPERQRVAEEAIPEPIPCLSASSDG